MNPQMLYGRHMGYRGRFERGLREEDPKLLKLIEQIEQVKIEARQGGMRLRAMWQFFEVERDGNALKFFATPGDRDAAVRMEFPRQSGGHGLCLSDFVLPARQGRRDHVALFVTSAGEGILERAQAAKDAGEYVRSHALQALAVETAEAAAEWLHQRLRAAWGFPDSPGTADRELWQARYRGKRYSFGYPACPDLAGQEQLFQLLRPADIGVHLTEGHMMEPEASVSALVFHHPDASYYAVGEVAEVGPD